MITAKQIEDFRKKILVWFDVHKRNLPWRKSRDPYRILISEVMLQQTQVSRVIPKFEAWIKRFPTLESLTKASTRDILLSWSGLGYNRRALYLQNLAQEVMIHHKGQFPQDEVMLRKLPGIGAYTARALLCFAFNRQIAVVDTNVRKVILTHFKKDVKDTSQDMQRFADLLLPKGKAYEWNQALMDYASAFLKKEKVAIPKQKPFKNSDRYYRGEIVRLLLRHSTYSMKHIETYFYSIGKGISRERLEKIMESLQKHGFILQKNGVFTLSSDK